MCYAYHVDEVEGEARTVLRFANHVAPLKLAILPLSKKLSEPAKKIEAELRRYLKTDYDDAGSIGKRYRRQDEVGTPYCLTYDFESDTDQAVTIRERDSTRQERISLSQIKPFLVDKDLIVG